MELIKSYSCLLGDTPSRTHLIEHDIDGGDAQPIKQHFYQISPEKCEYLEGEYQT